MEITKKEQATLLEALRSEYYIPEIELDEITIRELSLEIKRDEKWCGRMLETKFNNGEVTRRKVRLPNKRIATAYRLAHE